ncbi:hypothetical protein CV093_11480 [Oceanobacillus sp. 143]|nr:hypothetical protein CV093_11480 [Oceanobacillus sp. 143]
MLKDAKEDYFHFLQIERGLSDNTITSYKRDLDDYMQYVEKSCGKSDWNSIARNDIIGYLYMLKDNGKSTSTISRHVSSIRSFHQFLIREQLVTQDASLHIETPKRKETTGYTIAGRN